MGEAGEEAGQLHLSILVGGGGHLAGQPPGESRVGEKKLLPVAGAGQLCCPSVVSCSTKRRPGMSNSCRKESTAGLPTNGAGKLATGPERAEAIGPVTPASGSRPKLPKRGEGGGGRGWDLRMPKKKEVQKSHRKKIRGVNRLVGQGARRCWLAGPGGGGPSGLRSPCLGNEVRILRQGF